MGEACLVFALHVVRSTKGEADPEKIIRAHDWTTHLGNAAQFFTGLAKNWEPKEDGGGE